MEIRALANGVLRELEARGYAETTLLHQRDHIYTQIERWVNDRYGGELTSAAAKEYLSELFDRWQSGYIGKAYYNQLRCAVKRLREHAENKNISLICSPVERTFQPSAKAIRVIEEALLATELTDDFKYKLHGVLRRFLCFAEAQGLCERTITRDVMVSYIHHCRNSSAGHMAYIVRSLKILSEYLVSIAAMPEAPDFRLIAPKRSPQKLIPVYSEQELSTVLSTLDRSTPTGKRAFALILLAIGTGLRAGDIANLKLQDIDWKARTISIVQGKTQNFLRLPISGQICNAVSDYILNGRPKADCTNVFLRVRAPFVAFNSGAQLGKILERICIKAGIEKKKGRSFHSLRRTFGTWLAAEEVQLTMIFQMLGQEHMDSSKPYLSFNDTQIFSCAMGFGDIPLKGGVYGGLR